MPATPKKTTQAASSPTESRERLPEIRLPRQDPCCEGPCDPPWRDDEQCSIWFETRYFRVPLGQERPSDVATAPRDSREYIEFRITYEHRLCRVGKQLGPLLYTVTLLPGEQVTLYESDRFTQITSAQDRFSVETTFSQFLSTIHTARLNSKLDLLGAKLSDLDSGTAASVGGLAGVLGLSEGDTKFGTSAHDHTSLNVSLVSDDFHQSVIESSRLTHAERSTVISTYAEKDVQSVTSRTLQNHNACRAVTYFVRKVMELYQLSTIVVDISYRVIAPKIPPDWHPITDLGWLPPPIQAQIKAILQLVPKVGALVARPKPISLPTDGTVYDPELAHCSSCEPARAAAIEIELKKKQAEALKAFLEAQLMEVELERRRQLLQNGELGPFEPCEEKQAVGAD